MYFSDVSTEYNKDHKYINVFEFINKVKDKWSYFDTKEYIDNFPRAKVVGVGEKRFEDKYIDATQFLEEMIKTPLYFSIKFDIEEFPASEVVPYEKNGDKLYGTKPWWLFRKSTTRETLGYIIAGMGVKIKQLNDVIENKETNEKELEWAKRYLEEMTEKFDEARDLLRDWEDECAE